MTLIKNSGEFRRGKHDARVQGRRVALRNSVAGAAASGREADIKPPFPISKDTPENRPFAYRQVRRLLSQFVFSARTRRLSRAPVTRRRAQILSARVAALGIMRRNRGLHFRMRFPVLAQNENDAEQQSGARLRGWHNRITEGRAVRHGRLHGGIDGYC